MIEEVHFVEPDLRAIDTASAEVIACTMWSDERPMRGLAALLDWRLAGRLSALVKSGFMRGEADEVVLVPGRPYLSFEKFWCSGSARALRSVTTSSGACSRVSAVRSMGST